MPPLFVGPAGKHVPQFVDMHFPTWNILRTKEAFTSERLPMMILDSTALLGLAALVSATGTLVWAFRRRP